MRKLVSKPCRFAILALRKTRSKSNEFISFSEGIFGDLGSITCPDKFITYFVTQERCGNLRH